MRGNMPNNIELRPNWVKDLANSSNGLTQHCYIPSLVKSTEYLYNEIENMFNRFTYDDPPMLRSYINGGQHYGCTEKFVASAQSKSSSLSTHISNTLGVSEFCITFNGLTKWSESFVDEVQKKFVQVIFSELGSPYGGCDFYSFIGNYGFTPFGVHDDDDHSLLIHLGPGKKTVYIWPREQYLLKTGHLLTSTDFQDLLPSGCKYDLDPGDFVFIPKGDFHVFETCKYSATMGFTIFPLNTSDDLNQVIAGLMSKEEKNVFFCTSEDYFTRSSAESSLISLTDFVYSRRMALKSNGFVTTLPQQKTLDSSTMQKKYIDLIRYYVPTYHPVCLCYLGERVVIFVRGRVVKLSVEKGLDHFVDFLNKTDAFTCSELINRMSENWSEKAVLALFSCIYSLGGIEEVHS
jgi:hypothetical protein